MKLLVRTSLLIVGGGITLVLWERGGGLVGGYKRLVRVRYDRVAKGGRPGFSLPLLPPLLSSHSHHLSPPLTTSHHLPHLSHQDTTFLHSVLYYISRTINKTALITIINESDLHTEATETLLG